MGRALHSPAGSRAAAAVYYPFLQDPFPGMYPFVRTAGEPTRILHAVRRAAAAGPVGALRGD